MTTELRYEVGAWTAYADLGKSAAGVWAILARDYYDAALELLSKKPRAPGVYLLRHSSGDGSKPASGVSRAQVI